MAHAIVLVDDATKPVLEAAQAFLRTVTASGHERKLAIVFTKLDRLKGDDFGSGGQGTRDKKNKVLAALDQGVLGVETALDGLSGAGRRLRRILDSGRVFFVGGIDEEIGGRARSTRKELNALLAFVRNANQPEHPLDATPCYDLAHFMFCIRTATDLFQKHWNAVLRDEHWTRIKALSRRFASQRSDEYDTLKPAAHLRDLLIEKFGPVVAEPRTWKQSNISTEMKDAAVARVLVELRKRVEDYISRRLREENLSGWRAAYDRRNTGSARLRANDIRSIYEDVAPVPDEVPAPLASKLLDDFREIFREAATAAGAEIIAG